MKNPFIMALVNALLSMISPELLRTLVDGMLDALEVKVLESGSKLDDIVVLPLIKVIREAFDLEDDAAPDPVPDPTTDGPDEVA